MHKTRKIIIAVLLLFLLWPGSLLAQDLQPLTSADVIARPYGMGGAFTAISDDASALIFNPAGLYQSGKLGLLASGGFVSDDIFKYGELAESIDRFSPEADDPQAFIEALPKDVNLTGQGIFGFKLGSAGAGGHFQSIIEGERREDYADYEYQMLQDGRIGLSGKIAALPAEIGLASYGINLRYQKITRGDYLLDVARENGTITSATQKEWQAADSGFAVDAGVMVQLTPMMRMGIMIENLWAAELNFQARERSYEYINSGWTEESSNLREESYIPPRSGRVGVALRAPVIGTTFVADVDNFPGFSVSRAGEPTLYLGVENDMLLNLLTIRGGTYRESDGQRVFTAGFGLNFVGGSLDLAGGIAPGGNRSSIQAAVSLDL
ncbi:MAG: hypothetical protein ACQEQG_07765 [Bacillota bacterium]